MKIFGGALVCGVLAVAVADAAEEGQAYSSGEVESWPEFEKAPKTELQAAPTPVVAADHEGGRPLEYIEEGETRFLDLARSLGIPMTHQPQWFQYWGGTIVHHPSMARPTYIMTFEPSEPRIVSIRMVDPPFLDEVATKVTPEQFEEYARGIYRKVFGEEPTGDLVFDRGGKGLGNGGRERAVWQVDVEGVRMGAQAEVSVSRKRSGRGKLTCTRGASGWEVERLKARLRERPVRVTERGAVAAAWRSWRAVRPKHYAKNKFEIRSELREFGSEKLRSGVLWRIDEMDYRLWTHPRYDSGLDGQVFHEVKLSDGHTTVDVLVDPVTGVVVRLQVGALPW